MYTGTLISEEDVNAMLSLCIIYIIYVNLNAHYKASGQTNRCLLCLWCCVKLHCSEVSTLLTYSATVWFQK